MQGAARTRNPVPDVEIRLSDFELGYVLGLIVGEGSFVGHANAGGSLTPALAVRLHARDPEPLRFLEARIGGRIYGPYLHDGRHYCHYALRGRGLERFVPILWAHLPQSYKREQFLEWCAKYGLTGA